MLATPVADASANTPFGNVLLATKLYIPSVRSVQGIIPRPRLLGRLNHGLTSRLVLLSAPPGFGKTTLVSEWAAVCGHSVAWLSLDAADNDPVRFQRYLVAALQTIAPQIGKTTQELLRSPQSPPMESILTMLVNETCSLPDHLILILDDYHTIEAAAVHNAMTFLLDNLPPCLHVVIATRADPPLPLARWRSRSQLVEIRTDDLRFMPAESATFLNRVMGLNLSTKDITALESRTEGWIVGLQMAAISLQGRPDAEAFIQAFSGSHHYVLDYLVEEVLSRQPEAVQTFLLRTSILERLVGPLCDAVTGRTGSQAVLEGLEKANLFLSPLDDERRWYRYHHLFGDVLRAKLQHAYPPEEIRALHRSASQWYERHGRIDKAVQHALLVEDFDHVAVLIERSAGSLLRRGELTTFECALALVEPEGNTRVLANKGAVMAGLPTPVDFSPIYAAHLLDASQAPQARCADVIGHPSTLLEPLSPRELQVLRLLAEGLSNRQIAAELVLAEGTIKAHVHTIYGKLGVQGRVQAIARARELGLL